MKNSKKVMALAASLLLVLGVIGGSLAYLLDKTDDVENTFLPTEVTCVINEEFNGVTKKNVTVTNTGDIDAYLRAAIVVNWVNDKGEVLGEAVPADAWTLTGMDAKWTQKADGYYYYADPVAPNGVTEKLIGECKLAEGKTAPAGYYLSVTILADAIQAEPPQARTEAGWL